MLATKVLSFSDLDCIPLANHLTPECINKIAEAKVPECETGYQVVEIDGTSECILQVTDDENCGKANVDFLWCNLCFRKYPFKNIFLYATVGN